MTKWGEKNGIEYLTMSEDRASEGLQVLRNGFFVDESFCISTGVDEDPAAQRYDQSHLSKSIKFLMPEQA